MKLGNLRLASTIVVCFISWFASESPGLSAEQVTKTDLFISGQEGYKLYRIPGIVVTTKGTVLAYCEARKSDRTDWGPIDILMRRSPDGGKTWLPRQQIVHVQGELPVNPVAAAQNLDRPGDNTVNNPVAIVDHETGAVHFLYCLEYMRCFSMRSDDDGVTWSEPVEITNVFERFREHYDWKVIATGPAHGIQLTRGEHKGRLVVPVWLSLGTGGHAHRPSVTSTIYSDDHGKTWHTGEIAVPDTPQFVYPNETVVVELADGRVMLNSRSESKQHRRLVTVSPDGATGWSQPRFDAALLEPICMAGIARVRYPQDGQSGVIAFSNPHNLTRSDGKEGPGVSRDRINVSIKLSYDEGKTWPEHRLLEKGHSAYSDLAVLPDGTILCLYERGSEDGKIRYGRLTVARFTEQWVKEGNEAAAVAVSPLAEVTAVSREVLPSKEPVQLAKSAAPDTVNRKTFDVVVVGGTPSGIACAVTAAREGCTVLLVQHNGHIGGMMTNGLMQWDALYGGPRSPLFTELLGNIERYYIDTFGRNSEVHQTIRYTHQHYPVGWVEPHVAEREFNRLVAAEPNITLLLHHYPNSVEIKGSLAKSVTLQKRTPAGDQQNTAIVVHGEAFVDATYEGDLFALAKVPYRVGREARDEYGEPHAGKIFVNIDHQSPQSGPAEGLNIFVYSSRQGGVDSDSPFTADGAVQAYNYRFCVTRDPNNRVPIPKPEGYRREEYVDYGRKYIAAAGGPNFKSHVNSPILPGENHAYPEADWATRDQITKRHLDFGLGLIWFLQHDESVSPERRKTFRIWGLPKDEFADNNHIPYEMYVREARRLVGRYVLTEHDGMLSRRFARTPVHSDSIAVTDWYMDSHSCTTDSRPGYEYDGKLILTEESRPAQIPYRCLLPRELDNLLVPVCLSASHVAWGAIRLEPVFMQTGEAAGQAVALAKSQQVTPAALDVDLLLRRLVQRQHLVSFFNDIKVTDTDPAIPAAQYFATRGFFADYNARLDEPILQSVAEVWHDGFTRLTQKSPSDPNELAERVHEAEAGTSPMTNQTRGQALLRMWKSLLAQ